MGRLADLIPRFRNGLLFGNYLKTVAHHHLSYMDLKIIRNFSCMKNILTQRRKYPPISTIGVFCQECVHSMTGTAVMACPSAT